MNFIIYDLEATCWLGRPPGGVTEVIEIGALRYNRVGEELGKFNRFIKPKVNPLLSPFCKELTSINQEQIDRADSFDRVIEDFQNWAEIYDEEYLFCSWGKFDQTLLSNDCDLHKIEHDWLEPHIDIKKQYHHHKRMDKEGGLKKTIRKEGFEFTGIQHRAISDAENLAKIFLKYIDIWSF